MSDKFISYLRVSTDKQGRSGLGMDAQREAIKRYLSGSNGVVLDEYVEVESGKKKDRPRLTEALKHCKLTGAVLVIAKLDRLSRNAHFLLTLQEEGVKFVAADMPEANNLTVGIMAMVAQQEREAISKRTKEALQQGFERPLLSLNVHCQKQYMSCTITLANHVNTSHFGMRTTCLLYVNTVGTMTVLFLAVYIK